MVFGEIPKKTGGEEGGCREWLLLGGRGLEVCFCFSLLNFGGICFEKKKGGPPTTGGRGHHFGEGKGCWGPPGGASTPLPTRKGQFGGSPHRGRPPLAFYCKGRDFFRGGPVFLRGGSMGPSPQKRGPIPWGGRGGAGEGGGPFLTLLGHFTHRSFGPGDPGGPGRGAPFRSPNPTLGFRFSIRCSAPKRPKFRAPRASGVFSGNFGAGFWVPGHSKVKKGGK